MDPLEETSKRLDKAMDSLERSIDLGMHLAAMLYERKQMETMRTRILRRIEDLIADMGRWELGVTWSSDWNGTVWLIRAGTDVVEGQLTYEISDQECTFDLWRCPVNYDTDDSLFGGHARYSKGSALQEALAGLEKALVEFPREVQDE